MKRTLITAMIAVLLLTSLAGATVPSQYAPEYFTANGSTTTFNFTFRIFDPTNDIEVYIRTDSTGVAPLLTLNSDYTLSATNNNFSSGGTITTVATYASGQTLVATRNTLLTQEAMFAQNRALENTLDRLTLQVQELERKWSLSISIPVTDPDTIDTEITNWIDRKGQFLAFSETTGEPIVSPGGISGSLTVSAYIETLLDDPSAPDAQSTLGLADGSADLTLNDLTVNDLIVSGNAGDLELDSVTTKGPWVDVTHSDFGADPTGISDSSTAIQAAWDSIKNIGGELYFPFGTYVCGTALDFRQTAPGDTYRYAVRGAQARLDFSASGITSGNLVVIGADSLANSSELGKFIVEGIQIIGPHAVGKPVETGAAATSTVGLSLEWALQATLRDIQVRRCYKGIYTNFSFPIQGQHINIYNCTVGMHVGDNSTHAFWEDINFVNNRFGLLLQPDAATNSVYGQVFHKPRFENNWVGAVIDPLDQGSSARGIGPCAFYDPYVESIDNEVFRIGRSVDLTDASSQGSDRDRAIQGIVINGGLWSSGAGWGAGHEPVFLKTSAAGDDVVGLTITNVPFEYTSLGNPDTVVALTFHGLGDNVVGLGGSAKTHVTNMPFTLGQDGVLRGILTLWDGAGGNTPGYIKIHSPNGSTWYLFVEDDGTVKVHNAVPTQNSDGTVIGSQT